MIESIRPEVTALYALQRYALHVFLSASVYLVTFRFFYWVIGKLHWERMRGWWALIAPAMLIFPFIVGREVYDVSNNDPIWKSFSDWSSWLVGFGLVIWGIYRLTPLFMEILCEIDCRRYAKRVEVAQDDSMVDGEHGSGKDNTGKSTSKGKSDGSA